MSRYIYETVGDRFANEVKNRNIVLRYRNFEAPKNEDLVKRFNVKSPPTIAIIQIKDGKMVKGKLADKIMSLASKEDAFVDYIEDEIRSYLGEIKK